MTQYPESLRSQIRALLRFEPYGVSSKKLSHYLDADLKRVSDALRKMSQNGQVIKGDDGLWYGKNHTNNAALVVPVIPPAPPAPPSPPPEPERTADELIEELQRIQFVPSEELRQVAPKEEVMVTLNLTVPASVARRVLEMV